MPAGLTGYQDWQRTEQVDTPAYVNETNSAHPSLTSYPAAGQVYDAQRFASLGLVMTPNGKDLTVTIAWYLDPLGTVLLGVRNIVVPDTSTAVYNPMRVILPNRGPFIKMQVRTNVGDSAFTWSVTAWGTNRTQPAEAMPLLNPIMASASLAAGAGAFVGAAIPDAYAGEAALYTAPSISVQCSVLLQTISFTGATQTIYNASFSGTAYVTVVLPLGKNQLIFFNSGSTAITIGYALTQSIGSGS